MSRKLLRGCAVKYAFLLSLLFGFITTRLLLTDLPAEIKVLAVILATILLYAVWFILALKKPAWCKRKTKT